MNRIKKVQIETIRDCNGKCRICNYRDERHKPFYMTDQIFNKIVQQVSELPNLETVCPYNHGEPFLDPNLFGRIRYIKAHLPDVRIEVSTNGLLLHERNIDAFCSLVDDRWISFHGVNPFTYEYTMGLLWSNAEKLRRFIKDRPETKFVISIGLTSKYTIEQVQDFWVCYDNVKLMTFVPRSRAGNIKSDEVESFYNPSNEDFDCWRFNLFLVYNTRGDLVPCSNDIRNEHVYANYKMPMKDIMRERERFREQNREGKRTICWKCENAN